MITIAIVLFALGVIVARLCRLARPRTVHCPLSTIHYGSIVDYGVAATFLEGLQGELVAVERLAFEGEEDASFGAVTTVCRDAGMLLIEPI